MVQNSDLVTNRQRATKSNKAGHTRGIRTSKSTEACPGGIMIIMTSSMIRKEDSSSITKDKSMEKKPHGAANMVGEEASSSLA